MNSQTPFRILGLLASCGVAWALICPHVAQGQENSKHREGSRSAELASNALSVGVDAELLGKATAALEALVENQKVAGAVIVVSRKGKVILEDAVGFARLEPKQPMQVDSIFRIFSMTKAITSVAVMQLVEEEKLELDAPISKYLTGFADTQLQSATDPKSLEKVEPPTVRDFLRHTSGLTYGIFGDTAVDRKYREAGILSPGDSNAMLVDKLSKLPLLNKPGTKFVYSVSSDVLGRLVEVASGMSLGQYFDAKIFSPLGMVDSGFYVPPDKADRFADNFGPSSDGGLRTIERAISSAYLRKPTFESGGGGLVSTAGDYIRFCNMLVGMGQAHGKQLLQPTTVREMTRNQLAASAYPIDVSGQRREGVGFGLGFSVVVDPIPGFEYVPQGEYGWGGAASTHFWISPQHELAVVVLTQHMPFTFQCESAVKPIIYDAIK